LQRKNRGLTQFLPADVRYYLSTDPKRGNIGKKSGFAGHRCLRLPARRLKAFYPEGDAVPQLGWSEKKQRSVAPRQSLDQRMRPARVSTAILRDSPVPHAVCDDERHPS